MSTQTANKNAREFTLYRSGKKVQPSYKNHAPHVIEEVFRFAQQAMGTKNVKIQSALVKHIWITGINNPPIHVRLRRVVSADNVNKTSCTFVELVPGNNKGALKKMNKATKHYEKKQARIE